MATLFDTLNAIFYKKKEYKYDKKDAGAYILALFLSIDPSLSILVNNFNHYQFLLPDELAYQYYFHAVPKGRRFLKWTKKDKVDKKRDEIIKQLSIKHNCSMMEVKKSLYEHNYK